MDKKFKFKLPIGDWSCDGHCQCEWYVIESNTPLEDVREAYFESVKKTGFDFIKEVCSEYESHTIDEPTYEALKELNIDFGFEIIEEDLEEGIWIEENDYIKMLFQFIRLSNPFIKLEIIPDDLDSFTFYGIDKQGRHIGHLGYGLL